jgi:hypothetical protein
VRINGGQLDQDSADELEYDVHEARQDPAELIDQKIRCRDSRSGEITEYVVVDYINSLVGGDYFMLEDRQGRRHNVAPEKLQEIRVD